MVNVLDIAVNTSLNVVKLGSKPTEDQLKTLNTEKNWQTLLRGAVGQIIEKHVLTGNSLCGAIKEGGIAESNIVRVSMIFIDLDSNVDVERVLKFPVVRDHALLVHHTFSSTPENPRLRVIYVLEDYIDADLAKATLVKLHRTFGTDISVDKSCIDPGRLYYGSPKEVIFRQFENRLPSDYALNDLESGVVDEYEVDTTPVSSDSRLEGIWKLIHKDLGEILNDHNLVIKMFFPDITDVLPITPQRSNVSAQYRGNPTYRTSTSGSSFDIFFNVDGSITWCDKSCPQDLKGHFIDYYYRYINRDISSGIPYQDHKSFYKTLGEIYNQCGVDFKKEDYLIFQASEKLPYIELFNIKANKNGLKITPNEIKIAEYFISQFQIIYSEAEKKIYIWNDDTGVYDPYFQAAFNSRLFHWVKSIFNPEHLEIYYEYFNDTIFKRIANLTKNYLKSSSLTAEVLKQDTNIIPFANGFYDITKATLVDRDSSIINLYCLPYDYNPTGKALELFRELLSNVVGDSRQLEDVIKWIACVVALRGSKVHVAAGFYGDSDAGKTSITDAILNMVSPDRILSKSIDFQSALGDKSSHGSARMVGKKLVCFTELSSFREMTKSEISRFKDIVAVDKFEVNYDIKYGGAGSSIESFALMLTCQDIPEINIEDQGLYRRLFWIGLKKSAADLTLHFEALKSPEFLGNLYSDLLQLPIDQYIEYFQKHFTKSEVFREISHKVSSDSDPFIQAVEELLEVTEDLKDRLKPAEINQRFTEYFAVENIYVRRFDSRQFGKMFKRAIQMCHPLYDSYDSNNRVYKRLKFK